MNGLRMVEAKQRHQGISSSSCYFCRFSADSRKRQLVTS
jgi:hypothetical protein